VINVCHRCGSYRADKVIDLDGPVAVCPACGYRHSFVRLPLLLVSGASGAGKTAVCNQLVGTLDAVVMLDADILWQPAFATPENNYRDFFETWLRVAKNIGQSGRPVVLFGAGIGVPANLEPCIERRYFAGLHTLALVCADAVLAARLHARPAWRESAGRGFVDAQLQFNQWFKDQPAIDRLDTTHATVAATVAGVVDWIEGVLGAYR